MCSHSASPRSVTSTSHYFLVQRRNGTFIAPPSPLQTLKCLSLVRGLADETSPSQSTDLGRTLEAPDRRNKEGSLSPLTIPPVQAPSLFPKSRLLFTAEAWALRFSNGSNKARLCKVESPFHSLHSAQPLHQNITSGFPMPSSLERPLNRVFRSLALLLCGCGKANDPVSLSIKQDTAILSFMELLCDIHGMKP